MIKVTIWNIAHNTELGEGNWNEQLKKVTLVEPPEPIPSVHDHIQIEMPWVPGQDLRWAYEVTGVKVTDNGVDLSVRALSPLEAFDLQNQIRDRSKK